MLQPALARSGAMTPQAVQARVAEQVQPLLGTLKELVGIESGGRDLEGLTQLATVIAQRPKTTGMAVK